MAFSIGRAVGPAVVRNRLRRRLRALLHEIHAADPLPAVIMLIGAKPAAAELTFDQLRQALEPMVDQIRRSSASTGRP